MDGEIKTVKLFTEIHTVIVLTTQLAPEYSTKIFKDFTKSERESKKADL